MNDDLSKHQHHTTACMT